MLNALQNRNLNVVDLSEGVWLRTAILPENHAALRSGFAGYPANPRWTVSKFHAWKTGRQLREGLHQGTMVVRSADSLLVPTAEGEEESRSSLATVGRQWLTWLDWKKYSLSHFQTV